MSVPIERIIELSELRIGNYLEYKGEIVHVTMLSLDIDDEYQDIIGFCKLDSFSNEHSDWNRALAATLNRIPITPEWLMKLGFISTGSGDDNHIATLWKHRLTEYLYCEDGQLVFNGREYSNWHDIGNVKYVHELQNLFFAIVNAELTIKP